MPRGAGRIGWLLVWAVVFCDIGTSVYYVPGILYGELREHAGFFVALTTIAFGMLCVKQLEIARRFPSGGGVVSVGDAAFGPWWGCLGGQLIMVDFFLTVAVSAMSGMYYLDTALSLGSMLLPVTLAAIALLALLNIVGLKESATVSLVLALAALAIDVVVAAVVVAQAPAEVWARLWDASGRLLEVRPFDALAGYGMAWLAFSGLESLSQLSPAMRDLGATPRRGLLAIVASVLLTAPLLTFLSTLTLPEEVKQSSRDSFISALAAQWGGPALEIAVVLTASSLLLFAANTAILGNYHVQVALTRGGFLPEGLAQLSHRYQTPYRAILLCTAVPAVVLLATGGDMAQLGELYAFGLLGSFLLGSVGIDVLRYREGERGGRFWFGLLTTAALVVAWGVNLYAKPSATVFGGTMTVVGLAVALGTRRGWWEALAARIPGLRPPEVPAPTGARAFHTVASARALAEADPRPGVMVASRGAGAKLFQEAADRARARGLDRVYLIYVDEVPGLLYPQLGNPTPEGRQVLDAGVAALAALGVEAVPLWGLTHSAATTVAEAAETLHCDTVVIGATQRTFLWQALRGRFIQDLLAQLPPNIRLIVVG